MYPVRVLNGTLRLLAGRQWASAAPAKPKPEAESKPPASPAPTAKA